MAIAYDYIVPNSTVTGKTWSHTCSGIDRCLIVNYASKSTFVPTAVTYNGISMTLITSLQGTNTNICMWILLAPPVGTFTVSVSVTGTTGSGSSMSFTGVRQSSQPDAYNSGHHSTINPVITLSVVSANCWLVDGGYADTTNYSDNIYTQYSYSAFHDWQGYNAGAYELDSCASNGIVPTGTNTVTVSITTSGIDTGAIVISLAPSVPVVNNGGFFAFF